MTKQNALIRAEKVGGNLELAIQGELSDVFRVYQEITAQIFTNLVKNSKGKNKEEIAAYSVNALIHTLLCGAGVAFDENDGLDKELKPFVKAAVKNVTTGFGEDIDVYFAEEDDRETCKKAAEKMLDDLHNKAKEAAKKDDIDSMIDVLSTLAAIASAVRDAHKESAK